METTSDDTYVDDSEDFVTAQEENNDESNINYA